MNDDQIVVTDFEFRTIAAFHLIHRKFETEYDRVRVYPQAPLSYSTTVTYAVANNAFS